MLRPLTALLLTLPGCDEPAAPQPEAQACLPAPEPDGAQTCLTDRSAWADPALLPERISDTDCFTELSSRAVAPGLVPYEVNTPLFSDGSLKQRWLQLPPDTRVTYDEQGVMRFPVGAVLLKQFDLQEGQVRIPVETRAMVMGPDGWSFATWLWEPDGSEAWRVQEFTEVVVELGVRRQTWQVPGTDGCTHCHGERSRVLGPEVAQLDREVCYGDGPLQPQLEALADWGLAPEAPERPALSAPDDLSAPIDERARSYLHVNCASCHRPGGWTPPSMDMDLRFDTPLADSRTCDVPIQYMADPWETELRVAPGDPDASQLVVRMRGGGLGPMPGLGEQVDAQGVALVAEWIRGLEGCP